MYMYQARICKQWAGGFRFKNKISILAWTQYLLYLHNTAYKNSKRDFNIIAIFCQGRCGHIYVNNDRNKQTLYIYNFFRIMTLFEKLLPKVVKKRASNMKVYYIIPLNYQLTGHPENFKIKLYCFQKRLGFRQNLILKLLSLFNICFQQNNQLPKGPIF